MRDKSKPEGASEQTPQLRRTIGPVQMALYGLGSMLGAGIYGLIGKAAGVAGNAVWLAFLVALIAALLTALSYASLGSRYPRAAGAAYVEVVRNTPLTLVFFFFAFAYPRLEIVDLSGLEHPRELDLLRREARLLSDSAMPPVSTTSLDYNPN